MSPRFLISALFPHTASLPYLPKLTIDQYQKYERTTIKYEMNPHSQRQVKAHQGTKYKET